MEQGTPRINRRLYEASGDPFASAEALAIVHDVAGVVGDILCELAERGRKLPQRQRGGCRCTINSFRPF